MAKDRQTKQSSAVSAPPSAELGLDTFVRVREDAGINIQDLEEAYVRAIRGGDDPYGDETPASDRETPETSLGARPEPRPSRGAPTAASPLPAPAPPGAADTLHRAAETTLEPAPSPLDLSPRNILEAMLFGGPQPLPVEHVTALMRGVRAEDLEALVADLNDEYAQQRRPYAVVETRATGGAPAYRMLVRGDFHRLRDRIAPRRTRETRLSQAAIEVLSLVAYRQPITRHDVDRLRGTASAAVLRNLVRLQLLKIERAALDRRDVGYRTTDRFLQLFGLASLDELPQIQELEQR